MTDLQVKYWTMKEAERSNLANEGIKRDTLRETERANIKQEELKAESNKLEKLSIDNLERVQQADVALKNSNITLNESQRAKINAEIAKAYEDLKLIQANTALSQTEKDYYAYKIALGVTDSVAGVLGSLGSLAKGVASVGALIK